MWHALGMFFIYAVTMDKLEVALFKSISVVIDDKYLAGALQTYLTCVILHTITISQFGL